LYRLCKRINVRCSYFNDIDPKDLDDKYKKQYAKKYDLDIKTFLKAYYDVLKDGSWEKYKEKWAMK